MDGANCRECDPWNSTDCAHDATCLFSSSHHFQSRVLAAKALLERLRTEGGVSAQRLQDMERLSIAYIQLANLNVEQYKRETSEC